MIFGSPLKFLIIENRTAKCFFSGRQSLRQIPNAEVNNQSYYDVSVWEPKKKGDLRSDI